MRFTQVQCTLTDKWTVFVDKERMKNRFVDKGGLYDNSAIILCNYNFGSRFVK